MSPEKIEIPFSATTRNRPRISNRRSARCPARAANAAVWEWVHRPFCESPTKADGGQPPLHIREVANRDCAVLVAPRQARPVAAEGRSPFRTQRVDAERNEWRFVTAAIEGVAKSFRMLVGKKVGSGAKRAGGRIQGANPLARRNLDQRVLAG